MTVPIADRSVPMIRSPSQLLNTLDNQQPAVQGQAVISVGHEGFRSAEASDISTKPGGPPHSEDPHCHQPHGRVHLGI